MRGGWKILLIIFPIAVTFIFCQLETTLVKYKAVYDADIDTFFRYISDPKNFKAINPTIIDLSIQDHDHHSFRIYYTEHLVQIPFVLNYAYASYNIFNGPVRKLVSSHHTCFYIDFLCMPTNSTITAAKVREKYIHYEEAITYTCPWLLKPFCQREVQLQRELIMKNLARMF